MDWGLHGPDRKNVMYANGPGDSAGGSLDFMLTNMLHAYILLLTTQVVSSEILV